ncbi:hypothetical protein ACFFK0_20095 [Paenibacillus chartarius]|uniref:Lipoprotein n=1 Tax=Paenibacillus chartarius TaxID=747481 RepID=A0ABV6DQ16_9BACL
MAISLRRVFVSLIAMLTFAMIVTYAITCFDKSELKVSQKIDVHEQNRIEQELKKLERNKKNNPNEVFAVDFKELVHFEWDKMYIFGPYADGKDVNNKLGFHWTSETFINPSDEAHTIIFLKNNKIINYVEYWSFFKLNKEIFFPNDSKFEAEIDTNWVYWKPAK